MKWSAAMQVAVQTFAALSLAAGTCSAAAVENCYAKGRVPAEKQVYASSYIVMLDETVEFDATQRQHIAQQLKSLVVQGNELRVFTFSAFRDGRYTVPAMEVRLALDLDESTKQVIRKDHLREFEGCQTKSLREAKAGLDIALKDYFERSSSKLVSSDILGTLKEIGDAVFPTLRSKQRRLVLISDMLENSSMTSFYGPGGAPRAIEPSVEMAKVDKQSAFADFRAAAVYVIGAGVAPASNKSPGGTYRSQAVMTPLKTFWTQYFEKSNARLAEFGQPLLLTPIGGPK